MTSNGNYDQETRTNGHGHKPNGKIFTPAQGTFIAGVVGLASVVATIIGVLHWLDARFDNSIDRALMPVQHRIEILESDHNRLENRVRALEERMEREHD